MTLEEAEAEWQSLQAYVRDRMGDNYLEPSTHERSAYLYERLSGDNVSPRDIADPERRLRLWTVKYQELRGTDINLDAFLIDQINAARRG